MTKITVEKFREALKNSRGSITLIAERIGVLRDAVYKFINKHPNLKTELEHEKSKRLTTALMVLDKKLQDGDMDAVKIVLLKSKAGREEGFGEHIELEHSGKFEPITLIIEKADDADKFQTDTEARDSS